LLVKMLGNATASLGLATRLAQMQDAGVYRDEQSALAKAYCTVRMREVVGWARELLAVALAYFGEGFVECVGDVVRGKIRSGR
jgi:hypothetical protein